MRHELANWLRSLPGWEDARIEPLKSARANAWRLTAGSRTAVLKLDAEPRRAPYNTRAQEAAAQERAAVAGLAAPVYWSSSEGLLTAWLDGDSLVPGDLEDPDSLSALALSLKALHGLPPVGRPFDSTAWAEHYRAILESAGIFDAELERDWRLLNDLSLPGPLAFSHNDLVPRNLVARGESIRFIDFEYACDNTPLFDVATVIVEARLDRAARDLFTATYFDGSVNRYADVDTAIAAYEALVRLWEASTSPGVA